MPEHLHPRDFIHLLHDLQHHEDAQRHQTPESGELDPRLGLLRAWQSQRLARTYADLLSTKTYGPACRFFLSELYAPRDFSQRDLDAERLYAILSRYLPDSTLRLMAKAIRLNHLSGELDRRLLDAMVHPLGMQDAVTAELYAEGYRVCNNHAERKAQIDLLVDILCEVGVGARNPLLVASLKLAKAPAERAGWHTLYDFLLRGYQAWKPVRDYQYFARAIQDREMTILNRIFTRHPEPFL